MSRNNFSTAPVVIQERDLAILRDLFESRVMTIRHVAILHFDGRVEAVKKRLQKLKAARLVAERSRKAFDPAVLYLTRAGLMVLHEHGILREYPSSDLATLERRARVSEATLRHELEVMDVKVALCSAVANTAGLSTVQFTTWPELIRFRVRYTGETVKPDGFIQIRKRNHDGQVSTESFFLELDRSTERTAILVSRANSYRHHYKSGEFARRSGAARTDFREHPFRVLFVLKSEERRDSIAASLLHNSPPILSHAWLTTLEEITTNPLSAIWIRPFDFRSADTPTRVPLLTDGKDNIGCP